MNNFDFVRADAIDQAVGFKASNTLAQFIGGGTNVLDLMKENVTRPPALIDINRLPLNTIEDTPEGGLSLGAVVTNSATAYNEAVRQRYPLLVRAILAGASPQLRNMATNGGNLLQRTRCWYFYDTATPCNKRSPGSGCSALHGVNRMHAILGASDACIAVHPSDMCVALAALDATVVVKGPAGERVIPFQEFHRLPGDQPEKDTTLAPDELITRIILPPDGFARHWCYNKVRERSSYAFALVSAAVGLTIEGDTITAARVALGGVAHKPWRRPELETMLHGAIDRVRFQEFAAALLEGARGYGYNDYKLTLAQRVIVRAIEEAVAAEQTI